MDVITPILDIDAINNLLLDDAPFGVALLDQNLRYVYINNYLAKVNGLGVQEHVGEYIHEVLPGLSDSLTPILQSVLATGVPVTFELRHTPSAHNPDIMRDWLCCCYPARDVYRVTRGVSFTVSDVTETNVTERRLQLLSDNMQDVISLHSLDGKIIYASSSCKSQLGYTADELIGKDAYEMIHPADRARVKDHLDILKGDVRRTNYRVITKNGDIKWMEALSSPVKDDDGVVTVIQVSSRDVTEQVKTRAALRESEARLRITIEEMHDGLVLRDSNGDLMLANDAAERIVGMNREELWQSKGIFAELKYRREDGSIIQEEDYPYVACIRTGQPQNDFNMWRLKSNGEKQWVCINSSPLFREGETKPYAVVSTIRDITEQKKFEQQRLEQRTAEHMQRLSDRLFAIHESERRSLAANLHDELGGALTGLKLLLETTKRSDSASLVSRLNLATTMIQEMIVSVREMSMDLRPTILDHSGLIPALQWYFKRYTKQTGIRINFRKDKYIPRLSSDAEVALYRVIQEALTNIARHADVDRALISITCSRESIKVSVRDQGNGFDTETVHRRLDAAGLAGIRERLRLIGGKFELKTNVGKGTRITAELPLGSVMEETR